MTDEERALMEDAERRAAQTAPMQFASAWRAFRDAVYKELGIYRLYEWLVRKMGGRDHA